MNVEAKEIHEQKLNLMLELKHTVHGCRQRGRESWPHWIFIHGQWRN